MQFELILFRLESLRPILNLQCKELNHALGNPSIAFKVPISAN